MTARELRRISDPDDPDLVSLSALLNQVFPDEDTVLGLDRLREFLAERNTDRVFNAVIAQDDQVVVGCTVFSYVPASNCGFSEYIAVRKEARAAGLGRCLFDARRGLLDQQAREAGRGPCTGLFIEADNPRRVPAGFREMERESALDAEERLRLFAHLGFKRVDVVYVQPPLGIGKQSVSYLDLLFAPWAAKPTAIESAWVLETVAPIWRAWSPSTSADELRALQARLPAGSVRLLPPLVD